MAKINGITLDAVTSEEPQFESDVTEYPVESGGDTTDNTHNRPVGVVIQAIVSDATVGFEDERSGSGTPSARIREVLEELRRTRTPFTYVGVSRVYTSMIFETLSFPFDASTGGSLRISATLREIQTRDLVRVAARKKEFRAATRRESQKLWLCPYKAGGFLGLSGGNTTIPGTSSASNLKAGCRQVVMVNTKWVFKDSGKPLTSQQVNVMWSQNKKPVILEAQEKVDLGGGSPDAKLNLAAIPSLPRTGPAGKAITFAPGPKPTRLLVKDLKWEDPAFRKIY